MAQEKENFKDSCRLCLNKNRNFNIFSQFDTKQSLKYSDITELLTNLQIDESDNFPQTICINCAVRLADFHAFKEMCLKTYSKLMATTKKSINDPIMFPDQIKSENTFYSDNDNDNDDYNMNSYDDDDTNLLIFCETIDKSQMTGGNDDKKDRKKYSHKCSQCGGKDFLSKHKLTLHRQEMHKEIYNYQCDICKLLCVRKSNLSAHFQKVHINPMVKPLSQFTKKKKFLFGKRLNNDSNNEPATPLDIDNTLQMKRISTCKWCVKDFGTRKLLKKHYVAEHPDFFQYKCEICQLTFMRKSNMSCHIQKCLLTQKTKKEKIDDTAATGKMENMDDDDDFDFPYDDINDDQSDETKNQCKECGIFCGTRPKLMAHCHEKHPDIWNLQCHLCSQVFARQCMLSRHMSRSHQIKIDGDNDDSKQQAPIQRRIQLKNEFGQYCCGEPGCDVTFDMRYKLLRHNQLEHRDVWNLQCHLCSLFFKHKGNFTRHLRNSHACMPNGSPIDPNLLELPETSTPTSLLKLKRKKRRYDCVDCQQVFENQVKLWQHLAAYHYDVYKYECILCKRAFKIEKSLKVHMKKIHGFMSSSTSSAATNVDAILHQQHSIECLNCKQTFTNQHDYQQHSCSSLNGTIKNEMKCEQMSSMQSTTSSQSPSPYYHPLSGEIIVQQPILHRLE